MYRVHYAEGFDTAGEFATPMTAALAPLTANEPAARKKQTYAAVRDLASGATREAKRGVKREGLLGAPGATSRGGGGGGATRIVGDNQLRSSSPFKNGTSSSRYKGVTLHRRSGRWESHIWVRDTGRQLYLGLGEECENPTKNQKYSATAATATAAASCPLTRRRLHMTADVVPPESQVLLLLFFPTCNITFHAISMPVADEFFS